MLPGSILIPMILVTEQFKRQVIKTLFSLNNLVCKWEMDNGYCKIIAMNTSCQNASIRPHLTYMIRNTIVRLHLGQNWNEAQAFHIPVYSYVLIHYTLPSAIHAENPAQKKHITVR